MQYEQSEILEQSPLGVLVCDSKQRVSWANNRFSQETGLILEDIIGRLYASLPLEAIDKHAHIVQLFDDNSKKPKKFAYWQANINDPAGSVAHYFALERDQATKHTDVSKLPKRASWVEFLDYEVSRSRRYDNPLSLLKLHVLILKTPENIADETIRQTINDTLMDVLRWADMIGNTNQGSYLMVLPETPYSALEQLKGKISSAIETQLNFLSADLKCHIVFGSAHWQKHDDSQKMLKRAREHLVENLEKISAKSNG